MPKPFANAAVLLSLLLAASSVAPALAGNLYDAKCPSAGHEHGRISADASGPRIRHSVPLIERPRFDIRILSLGP